MQVHWRRLLDEINVEWADRGKNVGNGNINIRCPWCLDDPSKHLGISLARQAYYCYRSPNQHSGRNFVNLLVKLHQTPENAKKLLRKNLASEGGLHAAEFVKLVPDAHAHRTAWSRFTEAGSSKECVEYLAGRGYPSPAALCEQFDLRYSPTGVWARRLLLPMHLGGEVVTWTGRALTPRLETKYLMNVLPGYMAMYTPDVFKPPPKLGVVVEGPLDALRISQAARDERISVVALCGKALGAEKLIRMRDAFAGCNDIIVVMDSDVVMSTYYQVIADIRLAVKPARTGRGKLPSHVKDPGELRYEEVMPWLKEVCLTQRLEFPLMAGQRT